jgi:hypothetical protein
MGCVCSRRLVCAAQRDRERSRESGERRGERLYSFTGDLLSRSRLRSRPLRHRHRGKRRYEARLCPEQDHGQGATHAIKGILGWRTPAVLWGSWKGLAETIPADRGVAPSVGGGPAACPSPESTTAALLVSTMP